MRTFVALSKGSITSVTDGGEPDRAGGRRRLLCFSVRPRIIFSFPSSASRTVHNNAATSRMPNTKQSRTRSQQPVHRTTRRCKPRQVGADTGQYDVFLPRVSPTPRQSFPSLGKRAIFHYHGWLWVSPSTAIDQIEKSEGGGVGGGGGTKHRTR